MANRTIFNLVAALVLATCASTAAAQVITTFPYNDDFEAHTRATSSTPTTVYNFGQGWTELVSAGPATPVYWRVWSGTTTSTGTGPSTDFAPGTSTGHYVYLETSGGALGSEAIVMSPTFDYSTLANPSISFSYHMLGATMGNMHVDLIEAFNLGSDGANTGTTFNSASAIFHASHVGSTIEITSGANAGTYDIAAVVSATQVTLATAPPSNLSAMDFQHYLHTVDVVPSWTDNVDAWQNRQILLTSDLIGNGSVEYFAFLIRGFRGSSFTGDMAFDDVTVADGLPPTLTPASASLFDGSLTAQAIINQPVSNLTLVADDADNATVDVTVTPLTPAPGITAPSGGTNVSVPFNLTWTGSGTALGTYTYSIDINDGSNLVNKVVTIDVTPPLLELGSGTVTSGTTIPFNSTQTRYMTVYSAAEMASIPVGSQIDELQIHAVTTPATVPSWSTMVVRLGPSNTDPNAMDGTFDNNYSGSPTTVLNEVNFSPTQLPGTLNTGRYAFTFTTPHLYLGGGLTVEYQLGSRTGTGFNISSAAGRQRLYSSVAGIPPSANPTTSGDYGLTLYYTPPSGPVTAISNAATVGTLITGPQTDLVLMDLRPVAVNTPQTISSLTIAKSGTLPSGLIGQISLVEDVNLDGQVDAGDVVLGQGTLTADEITFTGGAGFPINIPISNPPRLLLAVNSSGQWPPGADVEFSIATSGDITWSGGTDFTTFPVSSGLITITEPMLTTTFADNNGTNPNMFDITTNANSIIVTRFDTNTSATTAVTYEIYIKTGSYVGFETNSAAWTLHDTVVTTGAGTGNPTPVPLNNNLLIPGSSTMGIYMATTSPSRYTTGANVYSNQDLTITTGAAVGYTFSGSIADRTWNGTVYYLPGPLLTVDATVGSRERLADNAGGTAGVEVGDFTIESGTEGGAELAEINVRASGSGDDSAAFSEISIYRDDDASGDYTAGDVLIDTITGGFPSDDGLLAFVVPPGPEQTFGINDLRKYFIVVKLNGTAAPTDAFDFTIESLDRGSQAGSGTAGIPSATMAGLEIEGPELAVSATAGTHDMLRFDEQGPGNNGTAVGTFTITANAFTGASATLSGMLIEASGTGDHSTAFTEVSIYEEDGTSAGYQFSEDNLVQTHVGGFPASNELTFSYTAPEVFAPNESRDYYVVVKLASTANPGETFDYQVTGLNVTSTFTAGIPSAVMLGLEIEAPTLTVTATLGNAASVWNDDQGPGNNGFEAATFDIDSDNLSGGLLNDVTIEASGTGDDSAAFVFVALYEEDGTTAGYQSGQDILVESHAGGFPSDDGMLTFTYTTPRSFTASETVQFYIVVSMAGTAVSGETFNFTVEDIDTPSFKAGLPSSAMLGVEIRRPTFTFTDNSPQQVEEVFPGDSDVLIQAFEVDYPDGPAQTLDIINIRATGTGHDVNHLVNVRLVNDANGNGIFDAGDTVLATDSYSLDNGSISFDLTAEPPFSPPETRNYLVLYDIDNSAPHGATFGSYMQFAVAQLPDSSLPINVPSVLGTAGVVILANVLDVDLVGPTTPVSVGAADTGPTNDGLLIADVTLTPPVGYSWTVTEMTFVATGSGPLDAAFSEVALYRDDGNGTWDGAAVDISAAAPASGFNAGTNDVTFNVTAPNLTANSTARFYLVGKLNGVASTGDTFNARLESIVASSTTAGQITGLPTADSDALIIDSAALTVTRGPNTPNGFLRKAGTAAQLLLGNMRMAATNDDIDVNSVTLTATGTGDWASSVDASSGVQLWLDNGDGSFDSGTDTLLAEQGGGATIALTPATALTVNKGSEVDLWVVVNILDTAGAGASDAADTFQLELAGSADVSVSGGAAVLVSRALPPTSAQMRILDFFVTSFTPLLDVETGGAVITIQGSGLIAPFVVRIDGQLAQGAAQYSGDGTQVTGLTVPPGVGTDLQIEISGGGLPAEIHTELFTYEPPPAPPKDDGGSDDDDGGCAAGNSPAIPAALLLLGAFAVYRVRRRHA